jgi:uncharacterized delta-60 repeat protein
MNSATTDGVGRIMIAVVSLSLGCQVANADPLDLDLAFNGTGKVVTNLQLDPQFAQDIARAVAIAQDGKIIAVGTAHNGDQKGYDFALVRYKPDGSIDAQAFGTSGRVTTDFTSANDDAVGVVIQPDGKIVVAGTVMDQSGDLKSSDLALARYSPNGTLDPGFGTNGLVRVDFGSFELASSIALQPDGKIVVAGARQSNGVNSDFLIARFLANGALDTGFGDAGKVVTDFGAWDIAWAVAIQNDGKIVAVGSTWGANFQPVHGVVARYNPNGTLDVSFSGILGKFCLLLQSCGKIKVNLGGGFYDYPKSVALRRADGTEDGKIVVAGQFGLARFNPNGSLDKDFANSGIMNTPDNTGDAVAILGNGRIVAAGEVAGDFAVAIYEPAGERCSGKGSVTTDFSADTDGALGIAVQSDGKIVLVGFAGNGKDWDFALARYQGGDCPANIWLGHYVTVHIFVHPQDLIGPPAPIHRKELFNRLQVGRSEQLAIPASDGGAFAGPMRSGYQAFELTEALAAERQTGSLVAVTTALGNSLLELLEAQRLLVPTDIAAGGTGRLMDSGSRSAPLLKCFRVRIHDDDGADHERKRVTITDALRRTWSLEVGQPESLCKPIDSHGRELTGAATGLLSYRVKDIGGPASPPSARLTVANEFGARMFQSGQPELALLPAVAE